MALALGLLLVSCGGERPARPVVGPATVATALASEPPPRRTMTDAIRFWEERLARRGEDALAERRLLAAYQLRFRAYGDPADLERAERRLARLLERYPEDPGLHAARATLHMTRHHFEAGLEAARRAVRLASPGPPPELRLTLFDAYLARGEEAAAAGLLRLPHDRNAFPFLVRDLRLKDRRGDVEEARDRMRRAVALTDAYAELPAVRAWGRVELGHFEHHSGHPGRAVARFLEALEILPGYPPALEGLAGLAYGVDGNLEAARDLYAAALENGSHPDLHVRLAEVESARGDEGAAVRHRERFLEAVRSDPHGGRAYWRPLALLLSEDPATRDEALEYARRDLRNRPTSESWDVLAWVLYRSGDVAAALDASRRSLEVEAPEPTVLHHAGLIAMAAGERDRGRRLLKAALEASSELGPVATEEIRSRLADG